MDFGEKVKTKREKMLMTQGELAEKVGYASKSTINKIEKGTRKVSYNKIVEIARVLRTTPEYLLGVEGEEIKPIEMPSIVEIPVLGRIPCGVPLEAIEEVEDEPVYIDRSLTIGGQTYYALRVVGESMIPEIRPQDIVVFRVQPVFNSGDIVVARIDGEATLKKAITVEKPRSVTLQPINPSYQPITFTGDTAEPQLEILGVVVQIIRNV